MNVEMRMADDAPEPHPEREKHFRAARVGDVAKIDNVLAFPAEPFAEATGDFAFGHGVVFSKAVGIG